MTLTKNRNDDFSTKVKIGDEDINGYIITKIYSRGDKYYIYDIDSKIRSESLKVDINEEPEDDLIDNYNKIKPELNEVKSMLFKSTSENYFKDTIAGAISLAIMGSIDRAVDILNFVKKSIDKEYKASLFNRQVYSWTCIFIVLFFILISYLTHRNSFFSVFENEPLVKYFIYISTFGAIGGAISIIIKLRNLNLSTEPYKSIIYYALERLFLAVLASICAFVLMKANLVLGVLNNPENIYGLLSAAIIAGFSETFIPDLLSKIEKENT